MVDSATFVELLEDELTPFKPRVDLNDSILDKVERVGHIRLIENGCSLLALLWLQLKHQVVKNGVVKVR